jgi:ubiquinone/menaquinone biosynthesis C-methylase UbiE
LKFKGTELVLDIGCGDGAITHVIAKKYIPKGKVIGIDLSEDMIKIAKKEYKEPNLDFKNISATEINATNSFDLVTSFYCLHWIKNQQKAVNSIAQSLKHNGKAILYIMANGADRKFLISNVIKEMTNSAKWSKLLRNYKMPVYFKTVKAFNKILNKANLKSNSVKIENKEIYFKNKESFKQWLNAIPIGSHLPENLRNDLINDITNYLANLLNTDTSKKIKFLLPTLIVEAKKV